MITLLVIYLVSLFAYITFFYYVIKRVYELKLTNDKIEKIINFFIATSAILICLSFFLLI
ncbi:TPA: hypothetical protein DD449_04790 [Candidatus Berkelbacteria bacterium]|nr:hypothetical protein [Candidatus Berkelbacteria bacterium]